MRPKTMRILHISSPKGWRGGERQAFLLAKELTGQGHNVYMFCPEESVMADRCSDYKIQTILFRKTSVFNPKLSIRIKRICLVNKIDIIHAHDPNAHSLAFLAAWIWKNKTPIVISRRVDFIPRNNWFTQLKYNNTHVRAIICVSEFIRKIMTRYLREQKRVEVIHSGIDISSSNQQSTNTIRELLNLPMGTKLVGNVSALADHKDYPTFIRVAEIIATKRYDYRFIIIGEGAERKALEAMIREKNLSDMVYLMGYRTDVAQLLPELDVFLFTSKMEGLGTVVLDAFVSAVPVVATDAGGIPEMIEHKISGLLSQVGDVDSLAGHVQEIIDNPSVGERLKSGARHKLESYTIENTTLQTERLYREVLDSEL